MRLFPCLLIASLLSERESTCSGDGGRNTWSSLLWCLRFGRPCDRCCGPLGLATRMFGFAFIAVFILLYVASFVNGRRCATAHGCVLGSVCLSPDWNIAPSCCLFDTIVFPDSVKERNIASPRDVPSIVDFVFVCKVITLCVHSHESRSCTP